MLNIFPEASGAATSAIWLDLLAPTNAERATAEAVAGLNLPTREALSEIETSSRIRMRDGILFMSVPSAAPLPPGERSGAPIGFILSRERLVTVRYTPLKSFDAVSKKFGSGDQAPTSGLEVFIELCEEIVDHIADGLEHLAGDLSPLSEAAFHVDDMKGRQSVRSNRILREQLRGVGRLGDRLSEIRDTLIGLNRIIAYATLNTEGMSAAPIRVRLASLEQDIVSLNDYNAQLFDRIQFLLDALVGLIGIAQNDIFKVLTIVSIVGIPPTLVASMYGMNFRGMPEYNWALGYQYGLTLIALSAIIPVVWFKIKGWF